MRKLIATLGLLALASAGCNHIAGQCDCGPQPGDAALYAPFNKDAAPLAGTYEQIPPPKR